MKLQELLEEKKQIIDGDGTSFGVLMNPLGLFDEFKF